jgi:signal transduction histidine kinase
MNQKELLIDLLIHDLTAPISIVFTSVKNLLNKPDKYGTTDQQKEVLERVLRNSGKAKTLLQELIEVYRSQEGQFCRESLLMREVVRESFLDAMEIISPHRAESLLCCTTDDEFFNSLQSQGITVEISGKYSKVSFPHDHRKLRQIVRNLISNALKYYQQKLTVSVSGDKDLVISVEDDGPGISEKAQENAFKRFATSKDKPEAMEGLGFGLSCVKTLVDTIGGDITLTSREGAGTCFTLRIPPL